MGWSWAGLAVVGNGTTVKLPSTPANAARSASGSPWAELRFSRAERKALPANSNLSCVIVVTPFT